mmetsp:Transcript_118480/g.271800  ORF Transcript_118480/g.271800 Transcript_118480/m.271800 type:complete len:266 (-) Transcript_118480:3946-4743(-)
MRWRSWTTTRVTSRILNWAAGPRRSTPSAPPSPPQLPRSWPPGPTSPSPPPSRTSATACATAPATSATTRKTGCKPRGPSPSAPPSTPSRSTKEPASFPPPRSSERRRPRRCAWPFPARLSAPTPTPRPGACASSRSDMSAVSVTTVPCGTAIPTRCPRGSAEGRRRPTLIFPFRRRTRCSGPSWRRCRRRRGGGTACVSRTPPPRRCDPSPTPPPTRGSLWTPPRPSTRGAFLRASTSPPWSGPTPWSTCRVTACQCPPTARSR